MHLSVNSSNELKNCRPTRALLYRGADTNLQDNEGKKPVDKARELESPSIMNELVRYLEQENGLLDCLMLSQPIRKVKKSFLMPGLFLIFNIIAYTLLILFIFPLYQIQVFIYISVALEVLASIFWITAGMMNPGYITKPESVDFL